jgi:hypothetical protein
LRRNCPPAAKCTGTKRTLADKRPLKALSSKAYSK